MNLFWYVAIGLSLMALGILCAIPVGRSLRRRKLDREFEGQPGGTVSLTEREAKLFAESEEIVRKNLRKRRGGP